MADGLFKSLVYQQYTFLAGFFVHKHVRLLLFRAYLLAPYKPKIDIYSIFCYYTLDIYNIFCYYTLYTVH